MATRRAELLVDCRNALGEGVQWHAPTGRLYWTDIEGRKLHACDSDGGNLTVTDLPDRLASFALNADGTLTAAFANGIYAYDLDTGACDRLAQIDLAEPSVRLNDGRCDRSGRFVVGGYNADDMKPACDVVRYDGTSVRRLIAGVGCANGIAFSRDGSRMYFGDTAGKHIVWFDYDTPSGDLGERHAFATLGEDEGIVKAMTTSVLGRKSEAVRRPVDATRLTRRSGSA